MQHTFNNLIKITRKKVVNGLYVSKIKQWLGANASTQCVVISFEIIMINTFFALIILVCSYGVENQTAPQSCNEKTASDVRGPQQISEIPESKREPAGNDKFEKIMNKALFLRL